jgi:hypothetical protein
MSDYMSDQAKKLVNDHWRFLKTLLEKFDVPDHRVDQAGEEFIKAMSAGYQGEAYLPPDTIDQGVAWLAEAAFIHGLKHRDEGR